MFVGDLREKMLVSPVEYPGDIGEITHIEPTSDNKGFRISVTLLERDIPTSESSRINTRWLVWPDELVQFILHDPRDYGLA